MNALTNGLVPVAAEASALVERLLPSVVLVRTPRGFGSGVIWESGGLIVTNDHVAARDAVEVELADGRRLRAAVEGRDRHNDLAALRVPAQELPAVPIGDSRVLRVGELIVAVGHPLGARGSATLGIVSAPAHGAGWLGRTRRELLQADLSLAPGSSGGPLANAAGEVVGIASMIAAPGIAIAVPSHVVCRFLAALHGVGISAGTARSGGFPPGILCAGPERGGG